MVWNDDRRSDTLEDAEELCQRSVAHAVQERVTKERLGNPTYLRLRTLQSDRQVENSSFKGTAFRSRTGWFECPKQLSGNKQSEHMDCDSHLCMVHLAWCMNMLQMSSQKMYHTWNGTKQFPDAEKKETEDMQIAHSETKAGSNKNNSEQESFYFDSFA